MNMYWKTEFNRALENTPIDSYNRRSLTMVKQNFEVEMQIANPGVNEKMLKVAMDTQWKEERRKASMYDNAHPPVDGVFVKYAVKEAVNGIQLVIIVDCTVISGIGVNLNPFRWEVNIDDDILVLGAHARWRDITLRYERLKKHSEKCNSKLERETAKYVAFRIWSEREQRHGRHLDELIQTAWGSTLSLYSGNEFGDAT